MDNIYPEAKLYWAKNASTPMASFFGKYFQNHTEAFAYLNFTRDRTPACTTAS